MQPKNASIHTTLPGTVRLVEGRSGLPCLRVSSDRHGTAEVYLQGAHVSAWQPSGESPVLWVSRDSAFERGRPIRGGVPVCFPWFAAHATDKAAPMHGFARISEWTLTGATDGADGVVLSFALHDDERTRASAWPHAFRAAYRVVFGRTLEMSLTVTNPGAQPIRFEEALHTYFAVHNVKEISIGGLEQTEYLDKVDAFARKRQGPEPIRFTGETDRVYLDTTAACTIHDPGRRRQIRIAKTGSASTVVWNPWIDKARAMPDFGDLEWAEMVCVETANVGDAAVTLAPGAEHSLTAVIEVTAAAS